MCALSSRSSQPSSLRPGSSPQIWITDSLSGEKKLFVPLQEGRVSFYTCGPTVYNFIHIGNLRTALTADAWVRYLRSVNYSVEYVRNYTDIDDKIIAEAQKQGVDAAQIAQKYIREVELDYAAAGMLDPDQKPRVSTHLNEIVEMIQSLLDQGAAYLASDGDVLFSIEKASDYGKLSGKKIEDLIAGFRVEANSNKKNPLDFVLWKGAKPGEPAWQSPWGAGRPGWHIECSAMAKRWLGDQLDLHHGGEDLIFPHHENEIAQSESANQKAPYVGTWIHSAFLTLSKTKMSKSLGNILTAREFLTRYSGEVTRYFLLSSHYRTRLDYDDVSLGQAVLQLRKIYEAKQKAREIQKQMRARSDLRAEAAWGDFLAGVELAKKEIARCFANDLNTAGAIGALFGVLRDWNRVLQEPLAVATPGAVIGAEQLISLIEDDLGSVLAIGRLVPEEGLARVQQAEESLRREAGGSTISEEKILSLIEERKAARSNKDFARADEIREDLLKQGVEIKDSPQGTTWRFTTASE